MTIVMREIPAGEFKAKCLHLLNNVSDRKVRYIITKRGKPVAQLIPLPAPKAGIFSDITPTFEITGDIIGPTGEAWDAER
jgi:prevent-host-death family protein